MKKRVLSGMRSSGQLHLGNYLGATKGMLDLQNDPHQETFYMVADLHALTTPYDPQKLYQQSQEVIIDYLAAGLDPQKSTLFLQSMVPQHLELAFFFSSVTTVARMQHLPTFKEKVKQYPQNATMALLNYPTLMAADILIYQASLVPVGIDQEPHLEVSREIARKMNQQYHTSFPEPQRFSTPGQYIPSLTGQGKMSKSVAGSYIALTDDLDTIHKKIRSVPTATQAGGTKTGGLKTLFTILEILDPPTAQKFEQQFQQGTLRFVDLKDTVTTTIHQELQPIQQKRQQLLQNPQKLQEIINQGAQKAQEVAQQTLLEVKKALGFLPSKN